MNDTSQDVGFRRAYRPLLELGRGGMAKVYLAESLASGIRKLVVLKVLNAELAVDPGMRAAFQREAELSAQMNHPNVVQVFEVAEYANIPVIAMEYLDGVPLSQILSQVRQKLPLRLHLHILAQVLTGLHHFHELTTFDGADLRAVHRDVSPQNVLVLHDGLVKVVDFGIAKVQAPDDNATRFGVVKGKIHYMPPEQLIGDPAIDRRADVFAVGVMLWEAAAKQRLWHGKNGTDVLRALASRKLPALRDVGPDVPSDVLRIVERAMAVDRNDRYPTAHEMQVELEQLLSDRGEVVQTRDLSDFMREHFGSVRQIRQLQIKNARRIPTNPEGTMDCTTPGTSMGSLFTGESSSSVAKVATLPAPPSMPGKKSRRSLGLIVLGALALSGAWFVRSRQRPEPAPAVKTVQVEIEALPVGSEILLDGIPVGQDHYRATPVSSERKTVLEARAPGYVSERREVSLRDDIAVKFVLQQGAIDKPDTTDPAPSSKPTAEIEPPKPAKSPAPAPPRVPQPRPTAPTASATPAPAENCNPAYTFSADGVKTYKPECF